MSLAILWKVSLLVHGTATCTSGRNQCDTRSTSEVPDAEQPRLLTTMNKVRAHDIYFISDVEA
eukprot:7944633-Alexandrium_andersonii.AAC.1